MKIKIEYKLEMLFGIIGGLILFLVGAVGSAQFYLTLIELGREYIRLNEEVAKLLADFFITLASLGGITVIVGGLFIGIGRRRIGGWLVGIGAGISLGTLLMKIYLLGPVIANLVKEARIAEALGLFGIEIGLVGLGVMLSFLSTLTNYRWMLYAFLLAMLNMYIGVTADPVIIELLISHFGLPKQARPYIYQLEALVAYIGLLYLVIMLIVGANYFKISKFLSLIALISLLPSEILMMITVVSLTQVISVLENVRLILHTANIIAIIIFIIKAKPVHAAKKKRVPRRGKYYEVVR